MIIGEILFGLTIGVLGIGVAAGIWLGVKELDE